MERCHLYLPLVDSSGTPYPYAEVTLLDADGSPVEDPVYLDPHGGAPQSWPVLVDPAVINLWTERPMRVTVQAALPGGATYTRTGVDIAPAPVVTVRTGEPLSIGSAEGLDGSALLAVSPHGRADWQVLDVLRFHRHEGDAPGSTVLGPTDLTDIYSEQTWLGVGSGGPSHGPGSTLVGPSARSLGAGATAVGHSSQAGQDAVAAGGTAVAGSTSVAAGAGSAAPGAGQVVLGRSSSAAAPSGVVLGSGLIGLASNDVQLAPLQATDNGSVVIGAGALPDLSWLPLQQYLAVLGTVVSPRYLGVHADAVLAGVSSTLGFYGGTGTVQPLVSTSGVTQATPGWAALLSLFSALDQLGLVYLLDGAVDDELADWTKTFAHSGTMTLETGDSDGSKAGDTTRARRSATGPGTVTWQRAADLRDFKVRVFASQAAPNPAALATELTAHVSPDNAAWTAVPLAWQPLAATTGTWYQTWAANARPLPAGARYLRLTLDVNASFTTPQIGRVLVR